MNADTNELVDIKRVASFSDNVISIALTLLVLDVRLPAGVSHLQWSDVRTQLLPRLLSFLLSFAIVGVFWVAHHIIFNTMRSAGHMMLWLNNLFLLTISLIPATAALLGSNGPSPISTLLYGINIACVGMAMLLLWHYNATHHRRIGLPIGAEITRTAYTRTITGMSIALAGAAMGFFHPKLSYGIFWLAPIAYILIQTAPGGLPDTTSVPGINQT